MLVGEQEIFVDEGHVEGRSRELTFVKAVLKSELSGVEPGGDVISSANP